MLKLLQTKNSKKHHWVPLLKKLFITMTGMVMAFAIIAPAQGQTITKPTRNRTTANFTMSENANTEVISRPALSMSHSADIHYAIGESVDTAEGDFAWWNRFEVNNQNKDPNSNAQPVTIVYDNRERVFKNKLIFI